MNNQIKQASTAQVCNYTITLSVKWVFVLIRNCQTLHCCYWAKHLSINLTIFNQVFVQSECRMKVCVFSVLFPVLLCVVIQWHGGNIVSVLSSFHRSVCLCFCVSSGLWFLTQTSSCLPRGYIWGWECVRGEMCTCLLCVGYEVSKRQSKLNPKIKGRECPSLPFNHSVCGEAVRKRRG